MGLHRLVEKVLTGVQFGTAYADEIRAIPYQRAGPIVVLGSGADPVLTARNSGTLFIKNDAVGANTFAPPNPVLDSGVYWDFYCAANNNVIVDSDTDLIVGYGADINISIIRSIVTVDRIGWGVRLISDGTQYFWQLDLSDAVQLVQKIS